MFQSLPFQTRTRPQIPMSPFRTQKSSRNSERRRIQVVLPYGVGAAPATGGVIDLLDPPATTALEAQLNEARRAKCGRDLRRERQVFLSRLTQEREDRIELEAWAASRVQALFRGFLVRPRPPRLRVREALTPAESNRVLVADLQAILARAGLPTIPGLGPDGRKAPEGSDWGRGRGVAGSNTRGGGLRRSRSRKYRAFEHEMGTRITKVVRGFLERRRYGRRWAEWDFERRQAAAALIERAWHSYRKRMGWRELESGVTDSAATKIQAPWRGMACRMALACRAKENALWKRKTVSAITIQTAARRRLAVARHGPKLTLGVVRREREARAAAEAAKPRRRWNRGGPATAAGTAGSGTDGATAMGLKISPAEGANSSKPADLATGAGRDGRSSGVVAAGKAGETSSKGAATAGKASPRQEDGSPARPPYESVTAGSRHDGVGLGATGKGGNAPGGKGMLAAAPMRDSGSTKTTWSSKHEPAEQGPAHGWEPGSRGVDSPGVSDGGGPANATALATQDDGHRSQSTERAKDKVGAAGVHFATDVDQSPSEIKKRASKKASLMFVHDSIHAAVLNAESTSRKEGTAALPNVPTSMATAYGLPSSGGVDGPGQGLEARSATLVAGLALAGSESSAGNSPLVGSHPTPREGLVCSEEEG